MSPLRTIVLALLAVVATAGCGRPRPAPLLVATNGWPGYEPFCLARPSGFLDLARVRLVEMSNNTDSIRAPKGGLIQGAALTLDAGLTLLQHPVDPGRLLAAP